MAALATNAEAAPPVPAGGVVVVVVEGVFVPEAVAVPEGAVVVEGVLVLGTVVVVELLLSTGFCGPFGPSGSIDPPFGGFGTTVLVPTEACLYFASVLSALFFGGLMTPLIPF